MSTTETTPADWARRFRAHGQMTVANMIDAANNSASGGFHRFTYGTRTAEFADKYGAEAWQTLCDHARDIGESPLNLLSKDHDKSEWDTLRICIVWWIIEHTGAALDDDPATAAALRVEFNDPDDPPAAESEVSQ